jgi:hypothetical protein
MGEVHPDEVRARRAASNLPRLTLLIFAEVGKRCAAAVSDRLERRPPVPTSTKRFDHRWRSHEPGQGSSLRRRWGAAPSLGSPSMHDMVCRSGRAKLGDAVIGQYAREVVRPESWTRPAGASPVWGIAVERSSRPRFVIERWRPERDVKGLLGGARQWRTWTRTLMHDHGLHQPMACTSSWAPSVTRRQGDHVQRPSVSCSRENHTHRSKGGWGTGLHGHRAPDDQ